MSGDGDGLRAILIEDTAGFIGMVTVPPGIMSCEPRESGLGRGMPVRTRFAPSPTGRLHLGHVFAAKVARDLARETTAGEFLLRFEDIDGPRVREEFFAEIEFDLQWLGLGWDGLVLCQSERRHAYESALSKLADLGLVYPCFCTRKEILRELEAMAAAPQGPEGPLYPGICRALPEAESAARIASGLPYCLRLNARLAGETTGELSFHDLRAGEIRVDPTLLGDVVLSRKDIGVAYHLAVVVDDAYQEISHVTRGEDLLPSTHVHRVLQHLLGLPEPLYLHHQLILGPDGKRLAKRSDSLAIATMRGNGLNPDEILRLIPDGW